MPVVYSNSLYDGNNVFNRDAIHFEQSLIWRRLTELIKNAYALNNAAAHIRSDRRNGAAEAVNYVVILYCNYLAHSLTALVTASTSSGFIVCISSTRAFIPCLRSSSAASRAM